MAPPVNCDKDTNFILNTKSGVVHPCTCSTISTLKLPDSSGQMLGFDTLAKAQEAAHDRHKEGNIPAGCKVPSTNPTPPTVTAPKPPIGGLTFPEALKLLKSSEGVDTRGRNSAHPGLHSPLNNESPDQMIQKIRSAYQSGGRTEPVTTMFRSLNDAVESLRTVLSKMANVVELQKAVNYKDRRSVSSEVNGTDPKISPIDVTLYSSPTNKSSVVTADKATLVMECDKKQGCSGIKDLTIVTFYPRQKR